MTFRNLFYFILLTAICTSSAFGQEYKHQSADGVFIISTDNEAYVSLPKVYSTQVFQNMNGGGLAMGILRVGGENFDMVANERSCSNGVCPFRARQDISAKLKEALSISDGVTFDVLNPSTNKPAFTVSHNLENLDTNKPAKPSTKEIKNSKADLNTAQSKTEVAASFPVSKLPSNLTNTQLIPFEEGKEVEWRSAYLLDVRSDYMDASCQATAYPYIRSKSYWDKVDADLKIVNNPASGNPQNLSHQSALALCTNKSNAQSFRAQLKKYPQRNFDSLCNLLVSPKSYRGANLGLVDQTSCIDIDAVKTKEHENCMKSYHAQQKSPTEAKTFCNCSANKVAEHFASGKNSISSKSLVTAGTSARTTCMQSVQSSGDKTPTAYSSTNTEDDQNTVQKDESVTVEQGLQKANEVVNKTKEKLKGLGGMLK